MIEELFEEFKREMGGAKIYCDEQGSRVQGEKGAILTLFTNLVKGLNVKGEISKDELQFAFDMAFKSDTELNKMVLEKLKDMLEQMNKKEKEE